MTMERKLRATHCRVFCDGRMFVPLSRKTLWICVQTGKPLHAVAKSRPPVSGTPTALGSKCEKTLPVAREVTKLVGYA